MKVVKYLSSYESDQYLRQNTDPDKHNSFFKASNRMQVGNDMISEVSEDDIPNILNRTYKD
jgi:type III secretory pathway component EscR